MFKKSISVILTLITIFSCMLPLMSVEANAATVHTITHHGYSNHELSQHPEIMEAGIIEYKDVNGTNRKIKVYARNFTKNSPHTNEEISEIIDSEVVNYEDSILQTPPKGCTSWKRLNSYNTSYPIKNSNGIWEEHIIYGCTGCSTTCDLKEYSDIQLVTVNYNKIYVHTEDIKSIPHNHKYRPSVFPNVPTMMNKNSWSGFFFGETILTPVERECANFPNYNNPSESDTAWDNRLLTGEMPAFFSDNNYSSLYPFMSTTAFERCEAEDGLMYVYHGDGFGDDGSVIMSLASQKVCKNYTTNKNGDKICNGHYVCKGHVSEYTGSFDFYVNSCPHQKSESQQSYLERVREAFFKILKFFFPFFF